MNSKIISKTLTLYFKQSVNWSVGQYIKKDLKRNCCWRYTGGKLEVTGASGSNVVGVNKFVTLEAGLTYNFSMDYIADQMGNNRGIEIKIQDLISGVYEVNSSYLDDDNTYTTSFIAPNTGQYEISVICIKANGNTNGFNNRTFTIDNVKLSHQDEEIECTCVPYSDYRYGFNGMEKDDEVKGKGNSYNYGARMLDSRLGRWLSIDAEGSNRESNYSAFANNPIVFEDINGDRIRRFTKSMRLYKQAVAQLGVLQGNVAAAIANTATTPANKTALLQIQSTLSTQMGNLTSLRSSSVLYNIKTTGMAINNGDNPADVRVN
ncbi:MAG: RHS repeat-associated protein, partial [Parvicella sp.]